MPKGILTSPSYPNYYPNDADCTYIVSQQTGTVMQMSVTSMDIEYTTQVLRDEIGTAVTNKKSRTESSCMARKGRGSTKSDFSRKRVSRCV